MAISFPSSPVLNQTYTVGSKTWIWNGYAWDLQIANNTSVLAFAQAAFDKANNALANTGSLVTSNPLTQYIIANTANSTSTTTGALVVSGGMGISGNLFLTNANTYSATQGSRLGWVDNYFYRSPQFNGVYFSGGFLSVINGSLYVEPASQFIARGNVTVGTIQADSQGTIPWTVRFSPQSNVKIQNTNSSISNTTGSLVLSGGLGVSGNVYADAIYDGGVEILTFVGAVNSTQNTWINNTDSVATGAYNKANNALANTGALVTSNPLTQYIIGNTTPSTSNVTGALVVSGGLGVSGNLFVSSSNTGMSTATSGRLGWTDGYFTRDLTSTYIRFQGSALVVQSGNFFNLGNSFLRGSIGNDSGNNTVVFNTTSPVLIQNTTTSTSTTTGALRVSGGLGVSGNIYADAIYDGGIELLSYFGGIDNTQNTNILNTDSVATGAYARANLAFNGLITANQNTAILFGIQTTQNTNISSADALARNAYNTANIGSNFVNTGGTVTGNVTITKDLTIQGNLSVLGTSTTITTSQLDVGDSLIYLANNNLTSDVVDIGIIGHYNDGANAHAGIFRDPNLKEWIFFKGYTPEVQSNNLINIAHPSFAFANLKVDVLRANGGIAFLDGTYQTTAGSSVANTNYLQGVDNTQNTRISSADALATGAYNKANNALANTSGTFEGSLIINSTVSGNAFSIIAEPYTPVGKQTWTFATQTGLGPTYPSYMSWPDGTRQLTAFTGSGIDQVARDTSNTASANTVIIQGVDTTQNTNISSADTLARNAYGVANLAFSGLITANQNTATLQSQVAVIQGVDTTQNTNISSADTLARNAYVRANSSVSFSTIYVAGQPQVKANVANSGLTFIAGSNMTITTSGTGNTITFSSTGTGGGGGGSGNANTTGWLPNGVIFGDATGTLSNTTNLQFTSTTNTLKVNGSIAVANTNTVNTASIIYNATLNSIDFIFN